LVEEVFVTAGLRTDSILTVLMGEILISFVCTWDKGRMTVGALWESSGGMSSVFTGLRPKSRRAVRVLVFALRSLGRCGDTPTSRVTTEHVTPTSRKLLLIDLKPEL